MLRTHALGLIFALVSVEALFSVPKLSWELATGDSSTRSVLFACATVAIILLSMWRFHETFARKFREIARSYAAIGQWQWMVLCILAGTLLRILWVLVFPTQQSSDYLTYFRLAQNLLEQGRYQVKAVGFAYWPPGYPFFLFVNFLVFGVHAWTPLLANLFLYGGTILGVYRLALHLTDQGVARMASLLLVLWPTYMTSAGLASKEMMLVLLLPVVLLLYLFSARSAERGKRLALIFLTGLVLGFASLTQPSMMLFPSVLLAYEMLRARNLVTYSARLAIVVFAMALVITPWTLRNHRVLNAWVLVSTNGGDVFYRANNPLATGGYIARGEQDLESLDEVRRAKVGFRLGREWIFAHPRSFLSLALRKQILFLGDDGKGVFETLKRGLEIADRLYILSKGISNLYWWGIWIFVFAAIYPSPGFLLTKNPELSLLVMSFLYLFALHSVFESGGKYHEPLLPVLAILAATLARETSVRGPEAV